MTFRCLRRLAAHVAALTTASAGALHAQAKSSSCGLLQVAELEAAIGGTVSTKPTGTAQAVPGMTLDECSLVISNKGKVHPISIRVVTNLGMDGTDAITVRNRGTAREQQWKVTGARLEQVKVGNAICILTGRPSVASNTVCAVPRGKGYVEVDVIGSVDELPSTATVGALVQKAVSRL